MVTLFLLGLLLARITAWETIADRADVFFRCVENPSIISRATSGKFADFDKYGETQYCRTLAIIAKHEKYGTTGHVTHPSPLLPPQINTFEDVVQYAAQRTFEENWLNSFSSKATGTTDYLLKL